MRRPLGLKGFVSLSQDVLYTPRGFTYHVLHRSSKVYFASGTIPELSCSVFEVRSDQKRPIVWKYPPEEAMPFLSWFGETVARACSDP